VDLCKLGEAQQSDRYIFVSDSPSQSELGLGASELLAHLSELLKHFHCLLFFSWPEVALECGTILVVGEAGTVWAFSVVVLSSQDTSGDGRPNRAANLVVLEAVVEIALELISAQHRVLWLLNHWLVPPILLTDADGGGNAWRSPLRGAPIEGKTFLDHVVHGSAALFQARLVVRSVREDHVNVVELQSLQRVLKTLNDVLPAHHCVIDTVTHAVDLGADHDRLATYVELLERGAHLSLSLAHAVDLSGIVEVDTVGKALLDRVPREVVSLFVVRVEPITVTKHADLEASATQVAVDHLGVVGF